MAPHRRKKISVNILVPFLAFILFFTIMIWQKYRSSHEIPQVTAPLSTEGSRTVSLFFAVDGVRLAREARVIESCDSANACLKSVIDELLNGPVGEFDDTIPDGTVVTAVHSEGPLATVEFNRIFSDAMLSGTTAEMLAVYAVVNTITVNFPQIQQVKIGIEGDKNASLRHLDISEPLAPDYSLELSASPPTENKSVGTGGIPRK